jgi:hypothetical protein
VITQGSRVTFYEDEDHEYDGTVIEVLISGESFRVQWDDSSVVDVCCVDELEEN